MEYQWGNSNSSALVVFLVCGFLGFFFCLTAGWFVPGRQDCKMWSRISLWSFLCTPNPAVSLPEHCLIKPITTPMDFLPWHNQGPIFKVCEVPTHMHSPSGVILVSTPLYLFLPFLRMYLLKQLKKKCSLINGAIIRTGPPEQILIATSF